MTAFSHSEAEYSLFQTIDSIQGVMVRTQLRDLTRGEFENKLNGKSVVSQITKLTST